MVSSIPAVSYRVPEVSGRDLQHRRPAQTGFSIFPSTSAFDTDRSCTTCIVKRGSSGCARAMVNSRACQNKKRKARAEKTEGENDV